MNQSDIASPEVFERFARIVAKSLHIDAARVTPDAGLDDLGAESLDLLEITMEAESQFNIWISEKTFLETAEEVFGPGVLVKDGVLTAEGKALLRYRMPEIDPKVLEGVLTVKDLNRLYMRAGTWARMIESLIEHTPKACKKCGGGYTATGAFRLKCTQCGVETLLLSGETINKRWVQEYYEKEYLPSVKGSPARAVQSPGAA